MKSDVPNIPINISILFPILRSTIKTFYRDLLHIGKHVSNHFKDIFDFILLVRIKHRY